MRSRIVVVFCDATKSIWDLCDSVDTFITQNASELNQFRLLITLYRPDYSAVDLIKSRYLSVTPHLLADSKPPCLPCLLHRHRVRYGLIIPSTHVSARPIWPYLDEIRHVLRTVHNLGYIRLAPDTDLINRTTDSPLVYQHYTRHIMIGNGNALATDYPVLYKTSTPDPSTHTTGVLRPQVFTLGGSTK